MFRSIVGRAWAVLICGLLASEAIAVPAAPRSFELGPEPRWVQPLPVDGLDAGLPEAAVQVPLLDRQTRVGGPRGSERYHRVVRRVRDGAGLQAAAQIGIEFDPVYQRLVLHRVEIRRGGARLDRLDPARVRVLQRETGLEQQRVDGRRTATIVLDDVRVGDRVEFAYTLVGDNPVFGGRFVDDDWTQSMHGPTGLYRYRLLAPAQRAIRHDAGVAEVHEAGRTADGLRVTEFRRRAAPAFVADANAPAAAYLPDRIQLSEFADWAEVASWADALFADASQPSPEVAAQAAALRAEDPQAHLLALLDFVQTQVRYFGTEIGASSHRPAPAARVLAQRYGDCKDKVVLLIAMARAAGVQARPVLVSTTLRRDVQRLLPSPLAFDHVVAVLDVGGTRLWVDGTRAMQTGPLAERQIRGFGWGLEAKAGVTALESLPGHEGRLQAQAEDVLTFGPLSEPASLEASWVFHGELAEAFRAQRAAQGAEAFDRAFRGDHQRVYPGLAPEGALAFEDVAGRNAVRLVQRYTLPPPWRLPEQRAFVADFAMPMLMSVLRLPDTADRQRPLGLAMPGLYRQSVVFRYAEPVLPRAATSNAQESTKAFDLRLRADATPRSQRAEAELEIRADRVAASDFPAYRDGLGRAWNRLAGSMQLPLLAPSQGERLEKRLAALQADVRAGRVRIVTAVQRDALVRRAVLDELLGGDRLTPALRVQTLTARAVELDHLGRLDDARLDLQTALALDPSHAPARAAAAVNALLRGDWEAAAAHADEALRLDPGDAAARETRARADYLRGDAAAARTGFESLLAERGAASSGYLPIWLYLATRKAGGDGADALRRALTAGDGDAAGWPRPVARWLAGETAFDAALASTRGPGGSDPGRECELQFFAGQKALLDGDRDAARRHLRRSLDTGVTEYLEHALARLELERLR